MAEVDTDSEAPAYSDWRLAALALAGFWALHLVSRSLLALLDGDTSQLRDPALIVALSFGFLLSVLLCLTLRALRRKGLAFGLAVSFVLSIPISLVYASVELAIFYHISPAANGTTQTMADGTTVEQQASGEVTYRRPGEARAVTVKLSPLKRRILAEAPRIVANNATGWYFFYFGLGALYVGLSSAARLRRAERRAAAFERLAHASQLRALRYQVNPHFLFNTLNSLSALILTRRVDEAETMILNLSAFFRSTLAIDPTADITLREELALQRLYLDIESVRFPDRLNVSVDIPDAVLDAAVPALLLQPLVENAVKYGVAQSPGLTTICIAAAGGDGGRIVITVENEASRASDGRISNGTGVGISNVRERLRTRFGGDASCSAGFDGRGVFRVTLTLPADRV